MEDSLDVSELIDFKNDNFARTHKKMYRKKFNLRAMANAATKIESDNERSINRFNYICRAQLL